MPDRNAHLASLYLSRIPDDVRKCLSGPEEAARVSEAIRLSAQANDPALSAAVRQASRDRAQAVLAARPGDVVAKEARALIAKADAIVGGGAPAEMLRLQAKRLVEEVDPLEEIRRRHRARVAKAKTDDPVPVFDQAGNLVGVCDPDDITPLGSAGGKAPPAEETAPAPAPAAPGADVPSAHPGAGGTVAKAVSRCPVVVYDQAGRPYATDRRNIRTTGVRKMADDSLVTVTDEAGRTYQVSRRVLASPEEQARNTGPVYAGGTTGMGQPRRTGPAAALPADGPQAALPGDAEARAIIKSLGPQWRMTYDGAGRLRGAVFQPDIRPAKPGHVLKGASALAYANVHNSAGRRVGIAPAARIVPLSELRTAGRVAKSLASPAQRRG